VSFSRGAGACRAVATPNALSKPACVALRINCLLSRMATGGFAARLLAVAMADDSTSSCGTMRCNNPSRSHSMALIMRPVRMSSTARDRPTISRNIQKPSALTMPELISGCPIVILSCPMR